METYKINTLKELEYIEDFEYIKTGFSEFDSLIGGFKKREISIIGGRPAIGKTTFCVSLCRSMLAANPVSILYFTLELSSNQLFKIFKLQNINEFPHKLTNSNIGICNPKFSAFDFLKFEKTLIKQKEENGLDVVVIDYMQLLCVENKGLNDLFIHLKKLIEKLNISLIVVSQLHSIVEERPNKQPIIEDLLNIDGYSECVNCIYFLHPSFTLNDTESRNLTIAKNKHAKGSTLTLKFNHHLRRFS